MMFEAPSFSIITTMTCGVLGPWLGARDRSVDVVVVVEEAGGMRWWTWGMSTGAAPEQQGTCAGPHRRRR